MRFIFFIFLSFLSTGHASVYFSETDLQNGLERGKQSQFQAIGQIIVYNSKNNSAFINVGTLVSPTKILTVRHLFDSISSIQQYIVAFILPHLNIERDDSHLHEVDTSSIVFPPQSALNENVLHVRDTYTNEDYLWSKKVPKFCQSDIAILTLKNPISNVVPFKDLMLDKPQQSFSNGYVVSTKNATVFPEEASERIDYFPKACVGIVKIARDTSTDLIFTALNLFSPNNTITPKLAVMGQQGDSGAPLIVKHDGILKIAAILSNGDCNPSSFLMFTTFTPLYPYSDWIREQLNS